MTDEHLPKETDSLDVGPTVKLIEIFFLQRLEMVWRDARWIMDCLQCVRSKQWVGAVPLGLVMGGDPPPCPDGEEEEDSLAARLKWPSWIQTQRSVAGNGATMGG